MPFKLSILCLLILLTISTWSGLPKSQHSSYKSLFHGFDNVAKNLVQTRDWTTLDKYAQHALKVDPNNTNMWLNVAIAKAFLNQEDLALDALKKILKEGKDVNWISYGQFFGRLSRKKMQHLCFLQAAQLGNKYAQSIVGAALLEGKLTTRNCQSARTWLRKAIQQDEKTSYGLLGITYLGRFGCDPDFKQAISYLKIGVENKLILSIQELADCYLEGIGVQKDISKAKEILLVGVKLKDPDSIYILANLIYENRKTEQDLKESLKYWRLAGSLGDVMAMNNYAYLSAQHNQNLNDALYYSILALKNRPNDLGIKDTVAWVLAKQEKYCEAKYFIDFLKNESNNNQQRNRHLVYIYQKIDENKLQCIESTEYEEIENGLASTLLIDAEITFNAGYYLKTQKILENALNIARIKFPPNHKKLIKAQNLLGNVYRELGYLKKSLKVFLSSLKILDLKVKDEYDVALVLYNNIGGIHTLLRDYPAAEKFHPLALEGLLETLGAEHQLTQITMNNIASVLQHRGKNKKVIKMCQKILQLKKKGVGENSVSYAKTQMVLSAAYFDLGQSKKGLDIATNALKLFEERLGENHPTSLSSRLNLIEFYLSQGQFQQASSLLDKSKRLISKQLGSHPQLASLYELSSEIFAKRGEFYTARQELQKALQIRLKVFGKQHSEVGRTYEALGTLCMQHGDLLAAKENYTEALKLVLKKFPNKHRLITFLQDKIIQCQ
ncbi:SEL1-like repeat protein [bacterium]|nr:SEL1-like repeat protein [bacterium]